MDPMPTFGQLPPLEIAGILVPSAVWASGLVAIVSLATASIAILFLGHRLKRAVLMEGPMPQLDDGTECALVFLDRKLWTATDRGEQFLSTLPGQGDAWSRIVNLFDENNETLDARMTALAASGQAFTTIVKDAQDRPLRLTGRPQGRGTLFRIQDLEEEQLDRQRLRDNLDGVRTDHQILNSITERAPLMMWRRSADGIVKWANAQTENVTDRSGTDWVLPDVFMTDCDGSGTSTRRSAFAASPGGAETWFEVLEFADGHGDYIGYASNIDSLVQTEASLQRFISTLTETFAQLPVGLSIFDAKRNLTLFNPALIDLLGFDPTRLARRPSLREFFDILRENRIVPGQKNFDDWRQYVTNVQEQAQDGTLHEKLELPSGQTFQVAGSPHPNGAIALIFEDISPIITLEQRYRAEIELSQATLDRLSEAVAVFDTSGSLVFANSAFAELWGFDPMEGLEPIRIVEATRLLSEQSIPTPVWGDLRDFATRSEDRAQWDAEIELTDGRLLYAGFSPLPDGSSLTVFSDITNEARVRANHRVELAAAEKLQSNRNTTLTLALDRLREAIRDATGDDQATDDDIRANLSEAVRQADQILTLDTKPASLSGPRMGELLVDLGKLAETRGIELDVSMDEEVAVMAVTDDLRRILLNMVMAVSDVLKSGSLAQMSIVGVDGGTAISCMGEAATGTGNPNEVLASLPMRLLDRIAKRANGTMNVVEFGAAPNVKIACTLPGLHIDGSGETHRIPAAG